MGEKNKTVSFRVEETSFEALREIADERDISLSQVFRDYVDALVKYDGRVTVQPETTPDTDGEFPPTVEVPRSFVREHERLELEAEHLREQLDEYKRYVTELSQQLDEYDDEDVIVLDDLDDGEDDESFRLG